MALTQIFRRLTGANKDKFSDNDKPELSYILIDTMSNFLYIFFFYLYITRIDNYIPETDGFRSMLKIIASTFLVLSFMGIILNIIDLF